MTKGVLPIVVWIGVVVVSWVLRRGTGEKSFGAASAIAVFVFLVLD